MRNPLPAKSTLCPRGGLVIAALLALALTSPAGASATVAPLPESDYEVRSPCPAPAPGAVGCLSLELTPTTTAARERKHPLGFSRSAPIIAAKASEGAYGLRPEDLRGAYFPGEAPDAPVSEPQTIALVDAYNDPNAEADLNTYSREFGLPECTTANGCFAKVNQYGESGNLPFPTTTANLKEQETICGRLVVGETRAQKSERETACAEVEAAQGWIIEISTDIEVAHAVCENCSILLVEADSVQYPYLDQAERTAAAHATEVSNSWGGEEPASEDPAFDDPRTVITAASGDEGYLNWTEAAEAAAKRTSYYAGADYPASSADVVAVGGTELTLKAGAWQSETVWNEDPGPDKKNHGAAGSGCSKHFLAPSWQQAVPDWSSVGCNTARAVADISADADPYSGVAVYDSTPDGKSLPAGWSTIGGTSVASPIIAAMFALAGGAHAVAYPAQTLYSHLGSTLLHEVTAGGSGKCKGNYSEGCSGSMTSALDCGQGELICNASIGYDGPTGVGTPNGIQAFQPTGSEPKTEVKEEKPAEEAKSEEESAASQHSGEAPPQAGSGSGTQPTTTDQPKISITVQELAPTPSSPSRASSLSAMRLSSLTLSPKARSAITRGRLRFSRLGFIFTSSSAGQVRVHLARQTSVNADERWRSVTATVTISVSKGVNARNLTLAGGLFAGRYLLTVAPVHGSARSLVFRAG